ncbi:probable cytochrome P450 4e1 [Epargyreus clarus]|uniref:probable cytochrome P450 4e1 n=1 Tax=Epargyreus clarus TaxID=520877 RepID=UPI003C2BB540
MYLLISLVVILIVLVLVHDYIRKCSYRWKMLSQFPGDPPLPLIGNALQIGFDADEASTKIKDIWIKHGKRNFRMTVGAEDWVLLTNPEDVGVILNHPTELSKPLERNMAMIPFFGNSLSTSEGERWRSTRKLMAPSFQFNTLERRVADVNMFCDRLFNVLDNSVNKGPIDMYRYLRPFMFDLLCNTLMGVDYNLLDNLDHPYLETSKNVVEIITINYFSYWRNIRALFELTPIYRDMMKTVETIRNTSDEIIMLRREKLDKLINNIKENNIHISDVDLEKLIKNKLSDNTCLLDSLLLSKLPDGQPTPNELINEEITLMCFTGHYTTTMTMSHTLYCLAKYPEIQQKVLDEQRTIFNDDLLKNPTTHHLSQMKYLEAVIKESIRVIPTVTKIGRQLQKDLTFKDGRVAPAGTSVIVFYEAMYLDPKIFPEPEKYNPERFYNNMHTFAFVPFSAGPRNCIGFRYAWVAMKTTLSNILRRYEVLPGGPGTEPEFAYRILTESKNGIQLNLRRREI